MSIDYSMKTNSNAIVSLLFVVAQLIESLTFVLWCLWVSSVKPTGYDQNRMCTLCSK